VSGFVTRLRPCSRLVQFFVCLDHYRYVEFVFSAPRSGRAHALPSRFVLQQKHHRLRESSRSPSATTKPFLAFSMSSGAPPAAVLSATDSVIRTNLIPPRAAVQAPVYWQPSVETYLAGPSSQLRGGARTRQAYSSESSYSACRPLQRDLEEAKRIHPPSDELLPVLLRHGRPRNLPVAWSCGCKRIFDRNPSN